MQAEIGGVWFGRRVGNAVVDPVGKHAVHVPEVLYLDRRRAARDDARPAIVAVAVEINHDVHAVSPDAFGNLGVGAPGNIEHRIQSRLGALLELIVAGIERVPEDLELGAGMGADQP